MLDLGRASERSRHTYRQRVTCAHRCRCRGIRRELPNVQEPLAETVQVRLSDHEPSLRAHSCAIAKFLLVGGILLLREQLAVS